MLKRMSIRKIAVASFTMFVLLIMYLIPSNDNDMELELKTDSIEYVYPNNLAVIYFYKEDCVNAKNYLNNSIIISDLAEKRYLLAEILLKEGNIKEGIKELNSLIQRNPNNIEYAISLTNIYLQQKNLFMARKTLKQFIKNNPQERNNPRFLSYGILKLGL